MNFTKALHDRGYELGGFNVIQIRNNGFSMFGMVNAEAARGTRFGEPAAVETNWYHHVILISGRGIVYDFDYLTTATPADLEQYAEQMFLQEHECSPASTPSGEFCMGRETKLNDYVWTVTPAANVLEENDQNSRELKMSDALDYFNHLL